MLSVMDIRDLQEQACAKACQRNLIPYVVWPQDVGNIASLKRIPNFGTYRPSGWEYLQSHFVDSSGFGEEDEPAMTAQAFANSLVVGRAYAIVSVGQFQVYVGEFQKEDTRCLT